MKGIIVLIVLLVILQRVCAQDVIWESLGNDDVERLDSLNAALNRFFGINRVSPCFAKYYGVYSDSEFERIRDLYTAALCVIFDANTTIPECNYDNTNITELDDLLPILASIHQPLQINEGEWLEWRNMMATFVQFFSPTVNYDEVIIALDQIQNVFVGNNGTLTGGCESVHVIDWLVPVTIIKSYDPDSTACFQWKDALAHTVRPTGVNRMDISAFGIGEASNAMQLGDNGTTDLCENVPDSTQPCFYRPDLAFVCYHFETIGTYTFDCAIHPGVQTAALAVAVTSTETNTQSTSVSSTSYTDDDDDDDILDSNKATTLNSFLDFLF